MILLKRLASIVLFCATGLGLVFLFSGCSRQVTKNPGPPSGEPCPIESVVVPALGGYVNDTVSVLRPNQVQELGNQMAALERDTGAQLVLLIVDTTGCHAIENFSLQVANTWKIGRARYNDGVLVTMAMNDRRLRIEVGYGLEAAIPNEYAKKIIDEQMVPYFKRGEFFTGIKNGIQALDQVIRSNPVRPQ